MGLYKKKILKVSKGQITSKLIERTDIGILDSSGQSIDNFTNSKYGNLTSVAGTKLAYVFGENKKVRLFNINLLDGTDAALAINATDDYIILIDKDGQTISSALSALGKFTESTLNRVCVAQNNDLILISSPGNPIYQLSIGDNNILQFGLFNIDAENVIKVNTLQTTDSNPIVFRDSITELPIRDLTYFQDNSINVNDYIQLSQTEDTTPSNSFPWSVIRLDSLPNPNTFSIETATINNSGTGYESGDIVSISNGATFTVGDESGIPTTSYTNRTTSLSSSIAITSVAYGLNMIIATGYSSGTTIASYIISSTDNGITWNTYTYYSSSTNNIFNEIKFFSATNTFVICGNNGNIITSSDGTNWITRTSGMYPKLNGSSYKSGLYMVVGDSGTILTSPDLSAWTLITSSSNYELKSVSNDGTNFVIIGSNEIGSPYPLLILVTSDGTNITSISTGLSTPYTSNLMNIVYTDKFIVVVSNGICITSNNGSSWVSHDVGGVAVSNVCYRNGLYTLVGQSSGNVLTTTDFSTFNTEYIGYSALFTACTYSPSSNIIMTRSTIVYQTVTTSQGLTINEPLAAYTTDPTGTGISVTGGSGEGMTIDIVSDITPATYTSTTYTAINNDICRNIWDDSNWIYSNSWINQVDSFISDQTYVKNWRVNATSGYITLTIQDAGYITIPKPTTYLGTPEQFAKKILIGLQLDGNDALGVMTIDSITGTASGSDYRITAISGITYITFLSTATSVSQPNFTIKYSQLPAFSSDYPDSINNPLALVNYPINILFYQQRLVIAGTTLDTAQMLFSQTATYNDFSDDLSGASTNAFQLRISGTEYESIQNVLLNQGIQIFTNKSEWLMNDSVITKSSGFIQNSKVGSSIVKPVIGGSSVTLFVQKNGLGLLGFIYNDSTASFNTPYISLFTDIIDSPIIDMCLKKGYSSNDDVLIYLTLSDGKIVIANYMNDQQIQAFVKQTSSDFKQTIQIDTSVLFLTTIGDTVGIEVLDTDKYTNASYDNFIYDFSTGVVSNLPSQYNGLEVNVYDADHIFVDSYTVASNTFTIPEEKRPTSISEIGFNIHSEFVSNPIDINSSTFSLYKTIKNISILVSEDNNTDYLLVNDKHGRNYKGFVCFPRPARPMRKSQFIIKNDVYPVEIMSIEVEVEA